MKKEKLKIIYEDKFIIVVDKQPKLLTISTDNEKEKTLFHKVMVYEKSKNKSNRVFIVHRLDKDTSGLIVFAKNERVKKILQDNWNDQVKRNYLAVVEGKISKKSDIIKSWLKETTTLKTYSSNKKNDGKLAVTKYNVLKQNDKYSLVDIEIHTGRKNQIRVYMSDINHPIVGDKKYGSKINPINRLCLHAYSIKMIHPITKEVLNLESNMPKVFNNLI